MLQSCTGPPLLPEVPVVVPVVLPVVVPMVVPLVVPVVPPVVVPMVVPLVVPTVEPVVVLLAGPPDDEPLDAAPSPAGRRSAPVRLPQATRATMTAGSRTRTRA
jgi:hypothetical protein